MKERILIYHTSEVFGGIENQIICMVKAMCDKCHFYFASPSNNKRLIAELQLLGVDILPTLSSSKFKQILQVARFTKIYGIKWVQVHIYIDSIVIRGLKILRPRIRVVNRVHTYIACSWIPMYKKRLYYLIDSITSPAIYRYIVNGRYMKDEMRTNTFIPEKKQILMLDGIPETGGYSPIHSYHSPIRILMIANVLKHKGHDVLIKGISTLVQRGKIIECRILGATDRDHQYFDELQRLINTRCLNEIVHFIGFDRDVYKYIKESDIIVLPSDSEGTPNCIMEAMSIGRICLATKTGALDEMIDDGVDGFLCKPCDPDDFARVLETILELDKESINNVSIAAHDKWARDMSLVAMNRVLTNIYLQGI